MGSAGGEEENPSLVVSASSPHCLQLKHTIRLCEQSQGELVYLALSARIMAFLVLFIGWGFGVEI